MYHSSITWFQANWSVKIWVSWPISVRAGCIQKIMCGKEYTFTQKWFVELNYQHSKDLMSCKEGTTCFLARPRTISCWKKSQPVLTGVFNHPHTLSKHVINGQCLHWGGIPQKTPKGFADIGRCESREGVKQMWCVWVTLITSRFIQARISLVCLISGHCLKVKVGHSHYLREHNTIIHTIQ